MEVTTKPDTSAPPARRDSFRQAYRWMLLARLAEEKVASLYRAGKIVGGVYLGRGQEAFSAALAMQLDSAGGDIFGPLIRDQAGRFAFGEPLLDFARTYLGSVEGPMRGRDGNIHRGRPRNGMPAMISHLGAMVPVVNGMLMAHRFRDRDRHQPIVGGVCVGDGATSTGAFHEGLNQAAVEKLPLVVSLADNQFAYSTPTDRQFACQDLFERAAGYGVEGYRIDATDLAACLETFATAVDRARNGHGPQLVVGHLLRLSGHGEHDDASYIPRELKDQRYGGDCLELARQTLLEEAWSTEEELESWREEAASEVEQAIATARGEEAPNPYRESWHALSTKHLAEGTPNPAP